MDEAWGYGGPSLLPIERRFTAGALYSTADIADIARCCTEHVRRACRNGTLAASQDRERGHWIAMGEDCRAWVQRGRPSGQ